MSNLLSLALNHGKSLHSLGVRDCLTRALLSRSLRKPSSVSPCVKRTHPANYSTKAYDVNTNVAKDVILYKYENPRFFKVFNAFGICQYIFWSYLSYFAFTSLRDTPVRVAREGEELSWYERINLGEDKYRYSITIISFFIGFGILASTWMFTLRSVRFLILRKGGRDVSLVTYGPFNHNRIMTVPLSDISAQQSREAASVKLPLKVRNRSMFYILDMRGEFRNTQLYDYTVGLHRGF